MVSILVARVRADAPPDRPRGEVLAPPRARERTRRAERDAWIRERVNGLANFGRAPIPN